MSSTKCTFPTTDNTARLHAVAACHLPVHINQLVSFTQKVILKLAGALLPSPLYCLPAEYQVYYPVLIGKVHGSRIWVSFKVCDAHYAVWAFTDISSICVGSVIVIVFMCKASSPSPLRREGSGEVGIFNIVGLFFISLHSSFASFQFIALPLPSLSERVEVRLHQCKVQLLLFQVSACHLNGNGISQTINLFFAASAQAVVLFVEFVIVIVEVADRNHAFALVLIQLHVESHSVTPEMTPSKVCPRRSVMNSTCLLCT